MAVINNDPYGFIKTPSTIVFISKRNSGKTIMSKDVIYSLAKRKLINAVYVISNTALISNDFSCVPSKNIMKFDDAKLEQLILLQTEAKQKNKNINLCLILDDIGNEAHGSKSLQFLFTCGRHINITVIVIVQVVKLISPACRENCDYIFMGVLGGSSIDSLYESVIYNGNKKQFKDFINDNVKDFHFVCYDNSTTDSTKRWRRIKATIRNFKLQSKELPKMKDKKIDDNSSSSSDTE